MRALLLLPALLIGCASPQITEADIRARAVNAPNIKLCNAIMYAPPIWANAARDEVARRSVDCREYTAAILQHQAESQANQRASADAADALARQFLAPPIQPLQPAVHCTTQRLGNYLQTDCR